MRIAVRSVDTEGDRIPYAAPGVDLEFGQRAPSARGLAARLKRRSQDIRRALEQGCRWSEHAVTPSSLGRMCAQLCPGHIDPGWPQISEGLRPLPVSKEDFVEAGETAGIISAKEQILIFGPHELWDRVAVAVKPFDAPHPSRVRQIESVPGVSADFGVGSAKGEKSDRMPFVPKHNGLGTGQVYVRIALEEFDLALEPGGVGDVVLIHSREVLSSREVYPLVESGRQAQVHSILDDSDSVVRRFEPCNAVVRRAIVDENQFPFTERLESDGRKRLGQSLPGVVHGQDDADERTGRHLHCHALARKFHVSSIPASKDTRGAQPETSLSLALSRMFTGTSNPRRSSTRISMRRPWADASGSMVLRTSRLDFPMPVPML